MSLFDDVPKAIFSVHSLAELGANFGIPIGERFAPTGLCRVLKQQVVRHQAELPFHLTDVRNGVIRVSRLRAKVAEAGPLVILMPLRLGIDHINPAYRHFILTCLEMPQSIGIIGGRPGQSFYLFGHQGPDELLYLDPHLLRSKLCNLGEALRSCDFHSTGVYRMTMDELDPSLLMGMVVKTVDDFDDLIRRLALAHVLAPLLTFE